MIRLSLSAVHHIIPTSISLGEFIFVARDLKGFLGRGCGFGLLENISAGNGARGQWAYSNRPRFYELGGCIELIDLACIVVCVFLNVC